MKDTAPTWLCNHSKKPNKEETAAVVITEQTPVISPPFPMLRRELSCIIKPMINNEKEFTFLSGYGSATILDSDTTSHLIKDRGYFIDKEDKDQLPVKTASRRDLLTTGRGTCIVEIELGGSTHCITLKDCLHAPGTMLNLLLVGRMLQKGWDCNFKGATTSTGSHCTLLYQGEQLGNVPASGNLFYLQVCFLYTTELTNKTTIYKEISALVLGKDMDTGYPPWVVSMGTYGYG